MCDENGAKITDDRPTKEIRQIVLTEGMRDGLNFHEFRRTSASTLWKQGVPIRVISAILGHGNENTTNLYRSIPQEDFYQAVQGLSMTSFLPNT